MFKPKTTFLFCTLLFLITSCDQSIYLKHKDMRECILLWDYQDPKEYRFYGEAICDSLGVVSLVLNDGRKLTRKTDFVPYKMAGEGAEFEVFIPNEEEHKKYCIYKDGDNYERNCFTATDYKYTPKLALISSTTILALKLIGIVAVGLFILLCFTTNFIAVGAWVCVCLTVIGLSVTLFGPLGLLSIIIAIGFSYALVFLQEPLKELKTKLQIFKKRKPL